MRQNLLSVEDLEVCFRNRNVVRAVDRIHFQIDREEILGIVGESGCGKTLTALSIMRLLPPHAVPSGRVVFGGQDLFRMSERDLRNIRGRDIAMIFQEPMTSLNPVFTVGYQIAEAILCHTGSTREEAMEKAIGLLRTVGIPSPEVRAGEYPHQLSGGMRQRVMIAMAVACRPSLLVADEPTTALDVTIQAQILELLTALVTGNRMSMLLITHDLGIIAEWAHRVIIMYAGRIVETAGVREIFLHSAHPYTRGLLESLPSGRKARLNPIPGQVPRLNELPPGCKFSPRCRYAMEKCLVREPDLLPFTGKDSSPVAAERDAGRSAHLSRCIRAGEI